MAPAVANWTDDTKLAKMHEQGWEERRRETIADEGRVLIELHHPGKRVVTFRSLRI